MIAVSAFLGILSFLAQDAIADTWDIQTVDSAGNVGQYTSIAVNGSGHPYIGYQDVTNADVKYAKWDGISWEIETVDSFGFVGQFLSMTLDSSSFAHMAYYNGTGNSLKYARWDGDKWMTETVDSGGVVGLYASIAVNASGYARISYYDAGNHDLKFAMWTGSSWNIETVDSAGDVGAYTSIALNATDSPRISYYDATNGNLKLANWTGNSWSIVTIDSAGDVGKYASMALHDTDSVDISYYDVTHAHLKHAGWEGAAWTVETVDSTNYVGMFSSISLDGSGSPRISYYDDSASALKYARWNGTAWNIEVVEGQGVGSHSSIAVDGAGYSHISYYDVTNQNLKYAKGRGNEPPNTPSTPSGPTLVSANVSYTYSTSTTDPEGDQVKYTFSWGDGTTSQTGYVNSGVTVYKSHSWSNRDTCPVKSLAMDVHGSQSWWSSPLVVTVVDPPSPPTDLTASPGDSEIVLSWIPPTDDGGSPVLNYSIYRGTAPGTEVFLLRIGNVTSHTDTGLTNGLTYYYKVRAESAVGAGPYSNEAHATPMTVPGPPTGLMAVAEDAQIKLNWTAPSDNGGSPITNYTIYRGTTPGGETLLAETPVVYTYVDTGLTYGVTYYYKATAKNVVGAGQSSNEANATPLTNPSPPRNLSATSTSHAVTLTWIVPAFDGGSPITNYTIYRGDWWGSVSFLTEIGNVTMYMDTGLTNGRSYYYAVTAKNIMGESGGSNEVKATPASLAGPPTNLTAVAGESQVRLTWLPPADNGGFVITNYSISRGTVSGGEVFLTVVGENPRYVDNGLTNGVTYYYKVAAITQAGQGPNSAEASARPATAPTSPSALRASAGNTQVVLSWAAPTFDGGYPVTNYLLYWGLTPAGEIYQIKLGNVTNYVHTSLTNGRTYYYKVAAKNDVAEGQRSAEANATPAALPGPPIGLSATPDTGQITLTWQPPADNGGFPIINYTLYRGTTSGGKTILATVGKSPTYADSALTDGVTYYYEVAAINSMGEGPRSNEANATLLRKPSEPRNLIASAGDQQTTLRWVEPTSVGGSSITNYSIYRGDWWGSESFLAEIGNVTSYTDTGLTNGRSYYYAVTAKNIMGESRWSNEVKATPATLPGAPANLTVVAGDSQARLSWSPPADNGGFVITNYSIWRGTAPGGELLLTVVGENPRYVDNGLTNGVTYYYTVAAMTKAGQGPNSTEASGKPATTPTAPGTLQAVAGNQEVALSWAVPTSDGGSPITKYTLYWGLAPAGEIYPIGLGNVTNYVHTSLTNGRTYYYKVAAGNDVGEGQRSAEANATPATLPGQPFGLSAVPDTGHITLTWQPPTDNGGFPVVNYTVYRGTTSGGKTLLATVGRSPTYLDSAVTDGVTYYYEVAAVSSMGEGSKSNEANATLLRKPSEPRNLIATAGDHQATLTWTEPMSNGGSPVINYRLYRGTTPGNDLFIAEVGNVTTYFDTSLDNGRTYYYKVRALNIVGEGPDSNEASANPGAMPGEPRVFAAVGGSKEVTLTWLPPIDDGGRQITGYEVYRGTASGEESFLLLVGNVLSYTDQGLTNGVTYYYKVAAVNVLGTGQSSLEASATPRDALPACRILIPSWSSRVSGVVSIQGDASDSDGTVQYVEVRIDGGSWVRATGDTAWSYDWDTTNLENGGHTIRARSYDGFNYSYEAAVTVTVENVIPQPPPEKSVFAEAWLWAVSAAVIFALVLLFVIILRRRDRKEKGEDVLTTLLDEDEGET